jgi:hypothetical protein
MNNTNTTDIIKYIKTNYPKIIFSRVNVSNVTEHKKALGFVITNNKFIVGYISKDGSLCKLIDPIDLNNISHENFINLIRKIPIVDGFDEKDKQRLIRLLDVSDNIVSKEQMITELKVANEELKGSNIELKSQKDILDNEIRELTAKYKVLVDSSNIDKNNVNQNILLIKSEHESEIEKIKHEYNEKISELENANRECKEKLLHEKENIIESIQKYKDEMQQYISKEVTKNKDAQEVIEKLTKEKEQVEKALKEFNDREIERLNKLQQEEDLHTDFSYQLNTKQEEINKLNDTINAIKTELKDIQEKFSKAEIENQMLVNFRNQCIAKILEEKEVIIQKIKEYNESWLNWAKDTEFNTEKYKQNLSNEMLVVTNNLKELLQNKSEYIKTLELDSKSKSDLIVKLESNISDIKNELNKVASDQLTAMSLKCAETSSEAESKLSEQLEAKEIEIKDLKKQLEEVRLLLQQNNNTIIKKEIDYNNCYSILEKFKNVNNMFVRKKEILKILDNIIFNESNLSIFSNLSDNIKANIKQKYDTIRNDINKYIDFLDLPKYINSPVIKLFQSKATQKNIPPDFCDNLVKISEYWDANVDIFRIQDTALTNIYEDLSGAVRVYIKIKPLIGVEQQNDTVYIESIQNKKQKRVTIDCNAVQDLDRDVKKETYGDFYGIFDESFSNLDVYTGIQGSQPVSGKFNVDIDSIITDAESVSPGLYSTFKQVEEGYSIVLFGYGLSGAGKTRLLVGDSSNNVPGLIHYGLANLQGVENIRIKYMFEQYIDKFAPTLNNLSGRIHNLVGEVPQMRKFAVNENDDFSEVIPLGLNLNNITVDSLFTLTNILEKYRIEHGRIKKTPNNPVSSRSHLYIVFEIRFQPRDGLPAKTGYITLVDTAGRESPKDIYNLFIDNTGRYKTNLTSILGPSGSAGTVAQYLKPEYKGKYDPANVYEILKEGVYINEAINHLIYFFNKKNYKKTKIIPQTNLDHYETSRYYADPRKEETSIDPFKNALTIPIMNFLDTLSNRGSTSTDDFRPTKFITFVCVRKDQQYCGQIFATLEFAMNIKSS